MDDLARDLKQALEFHQKLYGTLFFETKQEVTLTEPVRNGEPSPSVTDLASETPQMTEHSTETAPAQHHASPYSRIAALIPENNPVRDIETLADLEAYVRDTHLLPIDRTRQNPVFGVGNPGADLMLIGEAPGADEDLKGEPFVGKAGMLLNKILGAIEFERGDVYIANILKSRPPNNRNPEPEEIEAHIPILYRQISLIQPKLVLALGLVSACALLDRKVSLGSLRGKFHDFHGIPLLVTYHPAALLRNPNWKRPTWEDVQLLRKRYDELVPLRNLNFPPDS